MLTQLNHYQALGLSQSATEEEIKSAYKELALRYHPDKNADKETATAIFHRINEAYQVLSNQQSRNVYDLNLLQTETIGEFCSTVMDSEYTGDFPSCDATWSEEDDILSNFNNNEEFKVFKNFIKYTVLEEDLPDEEVASIENYLQMPIFRSSPLASKESGNFEGTFKESMLSHQQKKEPGLHSLSHKILRNNYMRDSSVAPRTNPKKNCKRKTG